MIDNSFIEFIDAVVTPLITFTIATFVVILLRPVMVTLILAIREKLRDGKNAKPKI